MQITKLLILSLLVNLAACHTSSLYTSTGQGTIWEFNRPNFDFRNFVKIIKFKNVYVALDQYWPGRILSLVLVSEDKINWKIVSSVGNDSFIKDIAASDEKILLLVWKKAEQGSKTVIISSANLADWKNVDIPVTNALNSIVFQGQFFMAGGLKGNILVSTDESGSQWAVSQAAIDVDFDGLGVVDGVIYNTNERQKSSFAKSSDGVTWTNADDEFDPIFLTFKNKILSSTDDFIFVSGVEDNKYTHISYRLPNSPSWQKCTPILRAYDLHDVKKNGAVFVAVNQKGDIFTSQDNCQTWRLTKDGRAILARSPFAYLIPLENGEFLAFINEMLTGQLR